MTTFKVKQVGNHWYPCVQHDLGYINGFDDRISRFLNKIDVFKNGELTFNLEEVGIIFEGENILYFNEADIVKYLMTDEDFEMHVIINNKQFVIHSDLYSILESNFQLDFHKNTYLISIY